MTGIGRVSRNDPCDAVEVGEHNAADPRCDYSPAVNARAVAADAIEAAVDDMARTLKGLRRAVRVLREPVHEHRPCGHPEDMCPPPGCCTDCGADL